MSKYFITDEVVKVDFPDGQWVEVKRELSQRDQDCIMDRMAKVKAGENKNEMEFSLGRMALLERVITNWSFVDDAGVRVPITPDNISNLKLKYRTLILTRVDALNKQTNEWAEKN